MNIVRNPGLTPGLNTFSVAGSDHAHEFFNRENNGQKNPPAIQAAECCRTCGVQYGQLADPNYVRAPDHVPTPREVREWNQMARQMGGAGIDVPAQDLRGPRIDEIDQ